MFIPLSVDRPLSRPTRVNHVLIALNVLAHVAVAAVVLPQAAAGAGVDDPSLSEPMHDIVARWGVQARSVLGENHEWWRLFTYGFIHGGSWHLIGNMLALWVFGASVEDRLGRIGYLALYLTGLVAAGLAHIFTDRAPAIGASGAVAAVSGAFFVLFPRTRVRVFMVFFMIGIVEIPAMWFIGAAVFLDLISQQFGGDDVAHAAHLGGYALGMSVAAILLATKLLAREPQYDLISIFKHSQRRAELRRVVREAEQERAAKRAAPSLEPDAATLSLRATLMQHLQTRDWTAAASATQQLAATTVGLASLDRRSLKELGGGLYAAGQTQAASLAFESLVRHYPQDDEVPHVSVLLALIVCRTPAGTAHASPDAHAAHAVTLLEAALPKLTDPDEIELAKGLLAEARTATPR
ncbi:MAG: rhomboid family intramembrane serine protease [Planctomycetota bacterium]|nr:rhomboid family intramembrane serine protease [Planctomycetota bacterium]